MNPETPNNAPIVDQTIREASDTAVAAAPAEPPAPVAAQPPHFRIIGVGNAGANLVEVLIKQGFEPRACAVLNSDAQSLAASGALQKFSIDGKHGRGIGCGGDPERGRVGAEACEAEITALCKDIPSILIVSGMGGGAGTGAAPVVARRAKAGGSTVICVAVFPFECEGALRRRIADSGFEDLRREADLVLPFYNDRAVPADSQTTLLDTFKSANELVACSIRSISHAFNAGSVMGLPFADICVLMRDRSDECILASAEASGADRAGVIAEKLMAHPALDRGTASLTEADAVAIYVLGGTSLGIGEVNKVVERTSQESASSPFIMGAAIQPVLGDTLSVLLLVGSQKEPRVQSRRAPEQPQSACTVDPEAVGGRPRSRMVPPPPEISQERARQIHQGGRSKKNAARMRQGQLPLDIISRGRFDKSEPTIHKGEDLDIPTYVRRGIALN